jgi:hypothetical protein
MKNTSKRFSLSINEWYFLFFWVLGGVFLYLYLNDVRPEFLNISVPAIASTYLEKRYFAIVKTNLMDELAMTFLLLGLYFLVFKMKADSKYDSLKLNSFLFALKVTLMLWLLSYLLFYGYIILAVSIIGFPFFILLFYVKFKLTLFYQKEKE